tara:strand:- start:237 stop:605 length:369 start_codon:yes stop_codon:yes gene_type:complete
MLNPNDLMSQKAALEAQLKEINDNIEKNKDVIATYEKAVKEVKAVQEKYKYTDEEFLNLLNSNFKVNIWVKVGDKAQQWPESKRGKLSEPYKAIVEAAGFTKMSEYIAKFKISEDEAKKLNA